MGDGWREKGGRRQFPEDNSQHSVTLRIFAFALMKRWHVNMTLVPSSVFLFYLRCLLECCCRSPNLVLSTVLAWTNRSCCHWSLYLVLSTVLTSSSWICCRWSMYLVLSTVLAWTSRSCCRWSMYLVLSMGLLPLKFVSSIICCSC